MDSQALVTQLSALVAQQQQLAALLAQQHQQTQEEFKILRTEIQQVEARLNRRRDGPAAEIIAKVVPEVTQQVTANVVPEVTQRVTANVVPEVIAKVVPEVTQQVTARVVPEVTQRVTANVVPEVTQRVTANVVPEVTAKIKEVIVHHNVAIAEVFEQALEPLAQDIRDIRNGLDNVRAENARNTIDIVALKRAK